MSLARLAEVLARTTGLDPQTLGARALADVLPRGVSPDDDAAVARLASALEHDVRARGELRANLLVHETSFFRYPASFAAMVRHLERRLAAGVAPVRVLSAACSTGQEPASLAMALFEAGVARGTALIDAFDVSESVVERARSGVFGERELASLGPERRARFTRPAPGGGRLVDEILALTSFVAADLLAEDLPGGPTSYDLILCRNVLIYLTPEARRRVLEALAQRLAPEGLLFVGHAEVVPLRAYGWAPVEPLDAYALGKAPPVQPAMARGPLPAAAPAPAQRSGRPARARAPESVERPTSAPAAAPAPPVPLLVRARRLAEAGRAEEAWRLLESEGAGSSSSVETLHLVAVLARALGRPDDVARALTRALYVDPRHVAALRLAALVAREAGEHEKAHRLAARAERAESEGSAPAAGGA